MKIDKFNTFANIAKFAKFANFDSGVRVREAGESSRLLDFSTPRLAVSPPRRI
jgi:hypothetical protein